jgi:hypothetical protein
MGLTNAILASEHGARRFGEASDWKTLMNSARANLPGIHIATSAIAVCNAAWAALLQLHFIWLRSGSEGQAGL